MSHLIRTSVFEKNVDKSKVWQQIVERAETEGDGAWFMEIRWLDDTVYGNLSKAKEAIERRDRGDYDALAVLFRDVDSVKDTANAARIRKRLEQRKRELGDAERAAGISNRAAAFVSCPVCGSKISTRHSVSDGSRCPVCRKGDLRSKTAVDKVRKCRERVAEEERKLAAAKIEGGKNAPVKWLLKYEFHV